MNAEFRKKCKQIRKYYHIGIIGRAETHLHLYESFCRIFSKLPRVANRLLLGETISISPTIDAAEDRDPERFDGLS